MIYFVDEDVNEMEPFAIELKNRGHDVRMLSDADEAFNILINASDIECVILDVMLAAAGKADSRFDSVRTNNFVITGLVLLDELKDQFVARQETIIPDKVIIFSAAQRNWIVEKITKKARDCGIEYLDKKDFNDTFSFATRIEEIMFP